MYPKKFENLIEAFHKLPGVGMKTAERYAYAVLDWNKDQIEDFVKDVQEINELHFCKICGNISDEEICSICKDTNRDHSIICVVANPKDILNIEKMNEYNGLYHVLGGLINTAKGILPEDLNIEHLAKRLNEDVKEIILALDPTIEGETTSLYLTKLFENKVKITHLAQGIPMGSKLDYADSLTLAKAFRSRH